MNEDKKVPGIVRAGIAHHALSQSLGYPSSACLATAIEADKKSYYLQLENASHGSLDVNVWLDYFAGTIIKALNIGREEVDFVLAKTRFYEVYGDQLNER